LIWAADDICDPLGAVGEVDLFVLAFDEQVVGEDWQLDDAFSLAVIADFLTKGQEAGNLPSGEIERECFFLPAFCMQDDPITGLGERRNLCSLGRISIDRVAGARSPVISDWFHE